MDCIICITFAHSCVWHKTNHRFSKLKSLLIKMKLQKTQNKSSTYYVGTWNMSVCIASRQIVWPLNVIYVLLAYNLISQENKQWQFIFALVLKTNLATQSFFRTMQFVETIDTIHFFWWFYFSFKQNCSVIHIPIYIRQQP